MQEKPIFYPVPHINWSYEMQEKPIFYPAYSLNFNGSEVVVHAGGDMAFVVLHDCDEPRLKSSLTLSVRPDNLYDKKGRLRLAPLNEYLKVMAHARSEIYTLDDIPF
jgi:hypothetical protein